MAYIKLHPIKQLDFQINRILTYGENACDFEEVAAAAKKITDIPTWNAVWRDLGIAAEREDRYLHAAFYYRLAEFFLNVSPEKEEMYTRSITNFHKIISQDDSVTMHQVPYQSKHLKAMHYHVPNSKETLVIFGGYDSFIEEFHLAIKGFLSYGYDIILFEGPGQGQCLRDGMTFEPQWEKPVSAVLDYFGLSDVCVVGISWGGYLALRAAAYEKRISRVVAYDILYDGFDCMTNPLPKAVKVILKLAFSLHAKAVINPLLTKLKQKRIIIDWAITHGQYITGTSTPYDFYMHLKKHTMKDICDQVTCDVLLLCGEKDHYIPVRHYEQLMNKLTNARTLHGRRFTEQEGGAEHCQIGNHQLAIDEIVSWLCGLS